MSTVQDIIKRGQKSNTLIKNRHVPVVEITAQSSLCHPQMHIKDKKKSEEKPRDPETSRPSLAENCDGV